MSEVITQQEAGQLARTEMMQAAGKAANQAAAVGVFEDYRSRKAANTLRRQAADLNSFSAFLQHVGVTPGELAHTPEAWRGVTWGMVEAFKRWLLAQGFALSTVNFRLSTVKVYVKLAMKAGAIGTEDSAMIHAVEGFSHKEFIHVDELRDTTRLGAKKAEAVSITTAQARLLLDQPDTPQGRRDAVLMALLLEHGLRCGEVALLQVESFDLDAGAFTFYRPKVQRIQNHKMTKATLLAVRAYLAQDHPLLAGQLLLATTKGGRKGSGGGKLGGLGMSERAITKRVEYLGELVGLPGLSAHDCRHYAATLLAKRKTITELMDIFGWTSPAMAVRYIERARIIEVD